ncbi:MAG: hypothetical protein WB611_20440 [Stellaceae bacterium]
MNGITALEARVVEAETRDGDLEARVAELEAQMERMREALIFLLEEPDEEDVPFESEDQGEG